MLLLLMYEKFATKFIGMFVNSLHTKFHMPSSNNSLVIIIIKPDVKYTLCQHVVLHSTAI